MDVEIIKSIANYGLGVVCLAVLILLHIYNVKVTIPELDRMSREQVFKIIETFKEELKEERTQCHDDHERLLVHVTENTEAIRENQVAIMRLLDRHSTNPK